MEHNYGLLRANLTRHFVESGTLEPCSIAPERALVRASARAGHGVHLPSRETAREYLERYAQANGIAADPLDHDRERYWRDFDKDRQAPLPGNYS